MKTIKTVDRKRIEDLFADVSTRHEELEDEVRVFNEALAKILEPLNAKRLEFADAVTAYNEALEDQQSCIDDALDRMSQRKREAVWDHYQGWKQVLDEGKAIDADDFEISEVELTGSVVPSDLPAMKLDDVEE
jgi:hypothetical protein